MEAFVAAPRTAHSLLASSSLDQPTDIRFVVHADVDSNDRVCIVGSCPGLGSWRVDKAFPLKRSGVDNSHWSGSLQLVLGSLFEYRAIVCSGSEQAPVLKSWEATGAKNRYLFPQQNEETVEWNYGEGVCEGEPVWVDAGIAHNNVQLRLTMGLMGGVSMNAAAPTADTGVSDITRIEISSLDGISKAVISLPVADPFLDVVVTAANMETCGFRAVFFSSQEVVAGHVVVLPAELSALFGTLTRPILNGSTIAGEFTVNFCVVKPYKSFKNDLSLTRPFEFSDAPQVIGHRGYGCSGYEKPRPSRILENTVLAFNAAAKKGIKYVEFDVQLTRDNVPVIYHDFFVNVGDRPSVVCDLTYHEFCKIYEAQGGYDDTPTPLAHLEQPLPQRRSRSVTREPSHLKDILNAKPYKQPAGSSVVPMSPGTVHRLKTTGLKIKPHAPFAIRESLPTLKALFKQVEPQVGFNIEIKYPEARLTRRKCKTFPERNVFLDRVLDCVFEHVGERSIYFSSFDAEVVMMLRQKQARFPVFFLTEGIQVSKRTDTRSINLHSAVRFAHHQRLTGCVTDLKGVMAFPEAIQEAHDHKLKLFTYGEGNNNPATIDKEMELKVDAIICDHITKILPYTTKTWGHLRPTKQALEVPSYLSN